MEPNPSYDFFALLEPWVILVCILLPMLYAERWIHQHTFGIGYLLTKDKQSATRLFYVFFLPGILVHEFVQYLVAGALDVPIKKITTWPDTQENGTLRLDFIVVEQDQTDPVRAALVAATPFFVMAMIVYFISTQILDLQDFAASFTSGDVTVIVAEFEEVFATTDFVLWFYLLFVVANSMLPKKEDRRGWPLILGVGGLVMAAMVLVGLDNVLLETLAGPVTEGLNLVNTALVTILVVDILAIFILGLVEDTLEAWRGFKMDYTSGEQLTSEPDSKPKTREPGSDEPYPAGEPLPSIYALTLPMDDPPAKKPSPIKATPAEESSGDAAPAYPATPRIRETTPEPPARANPTPDRPPTRPVAREAIPAKPERDRPSFGNAERPRPAQTASAARPREREDAQTDREKLFGASRNGERPGAPAPSGEGSRLGQSAPAPRSTQPPAPGPADDARPAQPARPRAEIQSERERLFGSGAPRTASRGAPASPATDEDIVFDDIRPDEDEEFNQDIYGDTD